MRPNVLDVKLRNFEPIFSRSPVRSGINIVLSHAVRRIVLPWCNATTVEYKLAFVFNSIRSPVQVVITQVRLAATAAGSCFSESVDFFHAAARSAELIGRENNRAG